MSNILSIVNIIALIGTLIFAIIQNVIILRQLIYLRKQITVESASSTSSAYLNMCLLSEQITDIFLTHPDIKKYFYENVDIDCDDIDYPLVETAAEKILDILEQMLWQRNNFPQIYGKHCNETKEEVSFEYLSWDEYIIYLFENSPILLRFSLEKEWHSDMLLSYARNILKGKQ